MIALALLATLYLGLVILVAKEMALLGDEPDGEETLLFI